MITNRPCNPQAQCKVERSHQQFRKKVMYNLKIQDRAGVNWA